MSALDLAAYGPKRSLRQFVVELTHILLRTHILRYASRVSFSAPKNALDSQGAHHHHTDHEWPLKVVDDRADQGGWSRLCSWVPKGYERESFAGEKAYKLVDDGRIKWNDPATKILPTFKRGNAEKTEQVLSNTFEERRLQ